MLSEPDKPPRFILYGAGGHARVVLDCARASRIEISLVIDDAGVTPAIDGINVVHSKNIDLASLEPFSFLIAIGSNSTRRALFDRVIRFGAPFNIIHPFSCVSIRASLGKGIVIMPGAIVNAGSSVQDNVIVNTAASIDHDCVIEPHSHICPGARLAGNVSVGTGTLVGTGASIIPGISIGRNCIIGAGSVVVRDIPDDTVACGVPARIVRKT